MYKEVHLEYCIVLHVYKILHVSGEIRQVGFRRWVLCPECWMEISVQGARKCILLKPMHG